MWNKGADDQKMFKGWVEDHDDGLFTMNYIPKAVGDYHIQVFLTNNDTKNVRVNLYVSLCLLLASLTFSFTLPTKVDKIFRADCVCLSVLGSILS